MKSDEQYESEVAAVLAQVSDLLLRRTTDNEHLLTRLQAVLAGTADTLDEKGAFYKFLKETSPNTMRSNDEIYRNYVMGGGRTDPEPVSTSSSASSTSYSINDYKGSLSDEIHKSMRDVYAEQERRMLMGMFAPVTEMRLFDKKKKFGPEA